jgi:transforming growth factor-beta-induced protein
MFRYLLTPAVLVAFGLVGFAKDREPADIVRTAATAGTFKTLVNLLVAADLTDALKGDGPFTVFAPTDEAFKKLPKGTLETLLKPENKEKLQAILTYHVVPNKPNFNLSAPASDRAFPFKTLNGQVVQVVKDGHGLTVNGISIVKANIPCKNGSVQVIEGVLMPPEKKEAGNSIVAVAEKAGKFKTLLAALSAAELTDVLGGDGSFTVFAPTDEAFAKLPKGAVENLLKPENRKDLVNVLKYHVVAAKLPAKVLAATEGIRMLQGEKVRVGFRDGRLTINDSGVLKTDVTADNGVIHVIDAVLMPGH